MHHWKDKTDRVLGNDEPAALCLMTAKHVDDVNMTGTEEQAFFNDGFYKDGNKIIANLFFRPTTKKRHLAVAAELEYAERYNVRTSSNNTTRVSLLIIYDF